jgi:prolipoprotein diacylglyceryltransferase
MRALASMLDFLLRPIISLKDHPVLLHIGSIYLVTVGAIIAFAAVASLLCADFLFKTMFPIETSSKYWIWNIVAVLMFSLFFSKIYHYMALGPEFIKNPKKHLSETAFYNQGGQLGVLVGTVWLSTSSEIDFFACMDIILTAGCLALAIGRIGCYNYGCCHGRPTSSRFGIAYTHPDSKVLRIFPELSNVPLVPTQLLSAAFNFVLFGSMVWMLTLNPKAGVVSGYCIITHNIFRAFIERYRISVINISARTADMKFFQRGAVLFAAAGVVYLCIALLWRPTMYLSFTPQLTSDGYLRSVAFHANTASAIMFISMVYIITWGIHYKKLGQHFEWD